MKTECCCQSLAHPNACGCCKATEATPLSTFNRPGLLALSYHVGTHASFLEAMKARLSNLCLGNEDDCQQGKGPYPLAKLTSREMDDFSIALLDACATVADVLTFYQERIINEGYLRTATERFSVLELARLVGYQPRPGVSASVYLAYTLDDNLKEAIILPKGARSQSIPGPDEMPQTFETSEDLKVRAAWNNLKPRTSQPQVIPFDQALVINEIYLDGTNISLKINDLILLVYGEKAGEKIARRVKTTETDFANNRTKVTLQEVPELIYIGVDILRSIINQLDVLLSADQQFLERRNTAQLLLVQYSLGKYPSLRGDISNQDQILSFLGLFINEVKKLFGTNNSEQFVKLFIAIAQISIEKYKRPIICFFKCLLVQIHLLDYIERRNLVVGAWRILGHDPFQEFILVLLEILESLLRSDQELYLGLSSLVRELLDGSASASELGEKFVSTLKKIKSQLDGITEPDTNILCDSSPETTNLTDLIAPDSPLIKSPVTQVATTLHLSREIKKAFSGNTRAIPEMLIHFQPHLDSVLYQALANANVTKEKSITPAGWNEEVVDEAGVKEASPELISLHALCLSAPLFGNNAPLKMELTSSEPPILRSKEWGFKDFNNEAKKRLFLDNAYDAIVAGAHVIIDDNHLTEKTSGRITAATANEVTIHPRTAYSISGKTTQIELSKEWWDASNMGSIRETIVYLETEKLALSMAPDISPVAGRSVDLQALYGGLPEGRWAIVSGELVDVPGISGVEIAELALIANVEQVSNQTLNGENKLRTRITFDKELAHRFKRDTVTIYGNVVKATHGETRKEVLGSGDSAKALQSFVLKQPPLTFISAANSSGVDSSLRVFVNDIQWRESDTLVELAPAERKFITRTDDDGRTAVIFGNGHKGARLPTGIENIKAEYRSGIGKAGNVNAGQISMLITRPLGVKEVINPLRASGGADKETRDQARKNVPLAVKSLDRLVSVQDYEDFARIYAGIGKAKAVELSDGRRQLVHITIAGIEDMPIEASSDLYRNLYQALLDCGDPYQAILLEIRELMLIVISANIRILPDYQWESVVTQVRTTLLDTFSFKRRELGHDVQLSEMISVMQAVPGVAYVDVDAFGGIPELHENEHRLLTPDEISDKVSGFTKTLNQHISVKLAGRCSTREKDCMSVHSAQIAYLAPAVPETLILNQIN